MPDAMEQAKISPQERCDALLDQIGDVARQTRAGATRSSWKSGTSRVTGPCGMWGTGREPFKVSFGQKKSPIGVASFQRWMRNDLQGSARFEDRLFIYPESDFSVLDIWLRSLRDIAQMAFAMRLQSPVSVVCPDQR